MRNRIQNLGSIASNFGSIIKLSSSQFFSNLVNNSANMSRRAFIGALVLVPFARISNSQASTSATPPKTADSSPIHNPAAQLDYYAEDGYDQANVIRVDVKTFTNPGICSEDDMSGCTLDDVNKDINNKDNFTVDIPVGFQAPDLNFDGKSANAIMRQRGQSSRRAPQKSYRVKLDSKKVLWRGERRLQLNKHPYDASRIRNKLAFDLMQTIPHLPSLRTQFVNLWIDDGAGPVDYGLFTHVEHVGKEYVKNRGLNDKDNIYKAEYFDFSAAALASLRVNAEGKPINKNNFESRLEIKRGKNHQTLYNMVEAVGNYDLPFDEVLERYFDFDNVLAWVTTNLLLLQKDATRRNFYLHNPTGTEKFYFLPWDYDRAFEPEHLLENSFDTYDLVRRLTYGYARGANSVFLDRFYRREGIHDAILKKARELRASSLSASNIDQLANSLATVAEPFKNTVPDAPISTNSQEDSRVFSQRVDLAYQQLTSQFKVPLPPKLNQPLVDAANVTITWSAAHDVTASGSVTYDLHVSSDVDFVDSTASYIVKGIPDVKPVATNIIPRSKLPSGELFVRLIARNAVNPDHNWQIASNLLKYNGKNYIGTVVLENRL